MLLSIMPVVSRPFDAVTVTAPPFTTYSPDMHSPPFSILIFVLISDGSFMILPLTEGW
jgi:hypothetical protein